MRIGIVALVIAIAMLATIQNVAAAPVGGFVAKGMVQYEDGTTCPYEWNLEMENLDQPQLEGQPWLETTRWTYPGFDYFIAGVTVADSDHIKVTITSPDGSYSGTNTMVASEAFSMNYSAPTLRWVCARIRLTKWSALFSSHLI